MTEKEYTEFVGLKMSLDQLEKLKMLARQSGFIKRDGEPNISAMLRELIMEKEATNES